MSAVLAMVLCATIAASQRPTFKRFVLSKPQFSKPSCPPSAYASVKASIRKAVLSSPDKDRWAARFLQLAFHDCLPRSCDASIIYEFTRRGNMRLDVPINLLEEHIAGTCVGTSDAIKIGLELSMELSGGPSVVCPMGNIEDAKEANPDDKLPVFSDSFEVIIADFTVMGFELVETLAGNYGAHSLGNFRSPAGTFNFTPKPALFSNDFTKFIVKGRKKRGFNALPSDIELFKDPRGAKHVKKFARNKFFLKQEFSKFLAKMCSI